MTKSTPTVWTSASGEELLRKKPFPDRWYAGGGTMNRETMRELGEAIADALKSEPPQAPPDSD